MYSEMPSEDYITVLNNRRETIEAVMARYLAAAGEGHANDEAKSAAHLLFGVVLDGINDAPQEPGLVAPFLRRHASRFGDGLTPILRDLLGPDVSDEFLSQCVDVYWKRLKEAIAA